MANEFTTWPILGDFQSNIKKELLRRKTQTFGEGNKPRAVWVRAVSNAIPRRGKSETVQEARASKNDGSLLRRDINIMVGGLLRPSGATRGGFEPVYQRVAKGRELLDRAMPGIESISVASKGEFGSLRKITINWLCPSVEDLDILMPYWLTPGISVMVEWGWSNIGQIPVPLDIEDDIEMAELYRFPAKVMKKVVLREGSTSGAYAGNQDFFIGIITNFTWNMNEDGSFTCTTELTTFGETMLALNLNKDVKKQGVGKSSSNGKKKKTAAEKKEEKEQVLHGVREYIERAFTEKNLQSQKDSLEGRGLDKRSIIETEITESYTSISFFGSITTPTIVHLPETGGDVFVTWEFIEKKIINDHVCPVVPGAEDWFAFELNSTQTKVSNDGEFLYSRNPKVLINNNNNLDLIPFATPPKDYDKETFGEVDSMKDGFLKNVYLKRRLILDTFNTSETLEEAIKKLINEIRVACFDLWDLKIQTNALAENQAQIIDQKYVSRKSLQDIGILLTNRDDDAKNDEIFNFGGYSGESVLRNVSFTSKMTNQVALTYFFGRNKADDQEKVVYSDDSDSGVQAVYGNTIDRVLRNLQFTTESELEEEEPPTPEDGNVDYYRIEIIDPEFDSDTISWIKTPNRRPDKKQKFYYTNEIDIKLVDQYLRRKGEANRQKLIPIYPLEISVTVDGISGILPGNVFTLDNLPKAYKESGVFQVVEIAHEVGSDDWTTTLRAFFRPVNPEDFIEPTSIAQESEDSESDGDFTTNESTT